MAEKSTDIPTEDVDDGKSPVVVRSVTFNQDGTALCVGSSRSYQIFEWGKEDSFQLVMENALTNSIMVERLYSSSLVACVSADYPRKLLLNHFKKNANICTYTYVQSILSVKLNRERLIVVFEDRISIHIVKDMDILHNIADTPSNPMGVCALANSVKNCYLAYPGDATTGLVQIFDAFNLKPVLQINAHEGQLQCLSFSDDGTKLATASVKGTVVRVFQITGTNAGSRLFEFRRGISRNVTIHGLSFSLDASFLLCSSNTSTVHVFKLSQDKPEEKETPAQPDTSSYYAYYASTLSSAVSATTSMLPTHLTEMISQERAFASATLPSEGHVTKLVLKKNILVVANNEGMVFMFKFDPKTGGQCELWKQQNLAPHIHTSNQELKELQPLDKSQSSPDTTPAGLKSLEDLYIDEIA